MQTKVLRLAFGIPSLFPNRPRSDPAVPQQGDHMSKTASYGLAPSPGLFDRLVATINRLLMASAAISNRNGDLPYFGL
jgi:hypothetical protein